MEPTSTILFKTFYYSLMALGVLIFLSNFTIFGILLSKSKKRPSELLVIFSLLIDSIYGLWITIFSSFRLYYSAQWVGVFNSLSFLSLSVCTFLLHNFVNFNRYIAVMRPLTYRKMFTYCRVVFALIVILVIGASSSLCYLEIRKTQDQEKYDLIWHFVRLAMILIEGVFTLIVYSTISKQFSISIWQPALKATKELINFLRSCLNPNSK